jgi:hypothetical protein
MEIKINIAGLLFDTDIKLDNDYKKVLRYDFLETLFNMIKYDIKNYISDDKYLEDIRNSLIIYSNDYNSIYSIKFKSNSIYKIIRNMEYNYFIGKRSNLSVMFIKYETNIYKLWNKFLEGKGILKL